MLTRVHILSLLAVLAISPCLAGSRDGSTKGKAIPLKHRDQAKAAEEEMQWMIKLFHYTPLLASRDALTEAIRKAKETKTTVHPPAPWEHATLEHGRQWCSYWMVRTPRGKRNIYFDAGISIDTPGAVPQIESSRAQYMGHALEAMKLQ